MSGLALLDVFGRIIRLRDNHVLKIFYEIASNMTICRLRDQRQEAAASILTSVCEGAVALY